MNDIRVLIVEDDPMVAYINKKFTEKIAGFLVVGLASTQDEALQVLHNQKVNLLILDLYLPQTSGLEVLAALREVQPELDAIVVTAADDSVTVAKVFRAGVVNYIEKPFQFEHYKSILESYRVFYHKVHKQMRLDQEDIDNFLTVPKVKKLSDIPKNFSEITLKNLLNHLKERDQYLSAEEIASAIGISRGTIRRYLEYLTTQGRVNKIMDYASVGRPVNRFKLKKL